MQLAVGKELKSGWLEKRNKHGFWQKRLFLLDSTTLTYYHNSDVRAYQLRDYQDVLDVGKEGVFEVVFSGSAPEVFPEKRLRVRVPKGEADEARSWADAIAAARRQLSIGAALSSGSTPAPAPAAAGLAPPPLAPPPLAPPPLAPPPPAPPPPPKPSTPAPAAVAVTPTAAAPAPSEASAPTAPPAAAKPAAPTVVPFEEMVRRQLRRKANVVLVERREEVLELLGRLQHTTWSREQLWPTPRVEATLLVLADEGGDDGDGDGGGGDGGAVARLRLRLRGVGVRSDPESADASVQVLEWWDEASRQMEELCLPLEGEKEETWAERLAIPKKGGGTHYTADEVALAGRAYARVAALYDYARLSRQLVDAAAQLRRIDAALAAQKSLSRQQRLERFAKAQRDALALAERVEHELPQLGARFAQVRLPDTLAASLERLHAALPSLLNAALRIAADDYTGWQAEAAGKRRFRTPGCHALLHAVLELAEEQRQRRRLDLSAEEAEAMETLRQREAELKVAAEAANAAIAEDLDEAV